ncbi:hypothetical protein ACFPN2_17360 [Steroidobacter flavus]|uniref:Uncharacterized protein n=1 Tax=Steroidobacter flavus TaxID=1842136 RepID=A0ABV8STR8_9GAMM
MPTIDDKTRQELARHREQKAIERSNAGKVLRRATKQLKALGFSRKSTFFAREKGHVIQFLHVHKFSFGPCFRVHACLRVLNEAQPHPILSGISSDDDAHYRMSIEYCNDEASMGKCAEEMLSYVKQVAEPWFQAQTHDVLLSSGSCLYPHQRQALSAALRGELDASRIALSRSLLGI